jgi:hypothetical protein
MNGRAFTDAEIAGLRRLATGPRSTDDVIAFARDHDRSLVSCHHKMLELRGRPMTYAERRAVRARKDA